MGSFLALLDLRPLVLALVQLQDIGGNIASSITDWLLPAKDDRVLRGLMSFKVCDWAWLL